MEPNTPQFRLRQDQKTAEQQERQSLTQQNQGNAREFSSAEELLRFDAAQVTPPPCIVERLQANLAKYPKPEKPWWRRLWLW
jgi:hypothetical protein